MSHNSLRGLFAVDRASPDGPSLLDLGTSVQVGEKVFRKRTLRRKFERAIAVDLSMGSPTTRIVCESEIGQPWNCACNVEGR
jgi:hypothetical protein